MQELGAMEDQGRRLYGLTTMDCRTMVYIVPGDDKWTRVCCVVLQDNPQGHVQLCLHQGRSLGRRAEVNWCNVRIKT